LDSWIKSTAYLRKIKLVFMTEAGVEIIFVTNGRELVGSGGMVEEEWTGRTEGDERERFAWIQSHTLFSRVLS
jgi:hypothetical protein